MPVSNGTGSEVFVITITDTNPIWFYCSQNIYTHCQSGMVGVINPPTSGSQNLTAYQAAAARTTGGSSGDLPQPVGGVVEPLSAAPTANSVSVATSTVTNKSCPSSGMRRKRSGQRDS
ncbi:hypothetical protein LTR85_009241 [Meristemomyces frigidus]|nr:hypothetical protein LTR85_009241 [Meristemomyces frigidus]